MYLVANKQFEKDIGGIMRKYFKVTFSDGDTISTWMNGTKEEITAYYVGNKFNLGSVEDNMQMAVSVEFMED